ncbi:MAG TPA: hypothetical protein V6C81_03895 [Planktothrix sp.]|jgi:hypothetical protein
MYQWRVNQIKLSLMERVLNHMERQGFEVQSIIPLYGAEREVVLAGKKLVKDGALPARSGIPAVTDRDIETIYRK